MKPNVKNTLQIHSQAKVEFYKTYLNRYLRILYLSDHIKNIHIYDVFCGMGIYEDGGKGSPVAAFDAIKEYLDNETTKRNDTKIKLIVNDKSEERVNKVKDYIDNLNHAYCEVIYSHLDIEVMFENVKQIVSKTKPDTRNLIFIDPYGYKEIKKDTILNLMKNGKTEIILFLPISHMYRFTNVALTDEEKAQYKPLRDFVNSFFADDHKIKTDGCCNPMQYIDFVADALSFNNHFYTTSYYIERDNSNKFALFFMSHHLLGFKKILEVKWELDEEEGRGFKLPEQQGNLFAEFFVEDSKNNNVNKLENI